MLSLANTQVHCFLIQSVLFMLMQ